MIAWNCIDYCRYIDIEVEHRKTRRRVLDVDRHYFHQFVDEHEHLNGYSLPYVLYASAPVVVVEQDDELVVRNNIHPFKRRSNLFDPPLSLLNDLHHLHR